MKILSFVVEGTPVPKARPRVTRYAVYTPATKTESVGKEYEDKVAILAKKAMLEQGHIITDSAIALTVEFWMPRPKKHYGTGKNIYKVKDRFLCVQHTKKPDIDNLIKTVKDAMNRIVWHDDSQVIQVEAYKTYSTHSRCEIKIKQIGAQ